MSISKRQTMMPKVAATAKLPKSALPYHLGQTLACAARLMGSLDPNVEAEIRTIVRKHNCDLRRYGHIGRNGRTRRASSLEYKISGSFGARVLAVLHGTKKEGKKLLSWEEVKSIANSVNPRLPTQEYVTVRDHPKSDGGYRPVADFQQVSRANQSLAKELIHMRHGPSRFEFAQKGRGRERLISEFDKANRNGGARAFGTADIENFFLSVKRPTVESILRISKAIIRNTIYIPHCVSIDMSATHVSANAVRAGLPQGALTSPIVAGLILEPVLTGLNTRLVWSYVDDIVVAARSLAEVEALLGTLAGLLKTQHPSSPLFEKFSKAQKIGSRADILGYWPRPNPPKFGGGLRFSPSEKSFRRFYIRAAIKLLKLPYSEWPAVLEARAYRWAASFKHWGGVLAGREFLQTVFATEIEPLLADANEAVLKAITQKQPESQVNEIAATYAKSIVPACVLVNAKGFCAALEW